MERIMPTDIYGMQYASCDVCRKPVAYPGLCFTCQADRNRKNNDFGKNNIVPLKDTFKKDDLLIKKDDPFKKLF